MQALRVTARLVNGYVSHDPWGPSLDGILAAVVMRERLGDDYVYASARPSDMRPVEGLPLERIDHGALWWYACSIPAVDAATKDRHYMHRRFDDTEAAARVPAVKRVNDKAGPYKATRLPLMRRVAPTILWHAIGHMGEVRRVLSKVDAIGARRAAGFGDVLEWAVEAGGDPDRARHGRPIPVDYAREHGIEGAVVLAGFRPPMRLACNTVECVVPRAS